MDDQPKPRIIIKKNGPYTVEGGVPLVRKTQVVSEYGEPLTWKKQENLETGGEPYHLCRCGLSKNLPFCDRSHRSEGFDGTECADTNPTASRQFTYPGGINLIVKKDPTLCMESGFCGLRNRTIAQLITAADDTQARSLVIAMIERCPSGALTYSIQGDQFTIEPDLPVQIADTTEITDQGPIIGPLWVTGEIEIVRSDGLPLETRNRVTLCNCGRSQNKPFCDGIHRQDGLRNRK